MNNIILIADNGGGMTLQINNTYQHYYPESNLQLCEDVYAAMCNDDVDCWDGNDIESGLLDPTYDEISSGGYDVLRVESEHDLLSWGIDHSWFNVCEFSTIYRTVIDK